MNKSYFLILASCGYFKNSIFRFNPLYFVLFTAEFLNTRLNVSSVISSQSFLVICNNSGFALKAGSECGLEKRFQGHTSWHTSQPNIQSSNCPFIESGIFSFSSIVK